MSTNLKMHLLVLIICLLIVPGYSTDGGVLQFYGLVLGGVMAFGAVVITVPACILLFIVLPCTMFNILVFGCCCCPDEDAGTRLAGLARSSSRRVQPQPRDSATEFSLKLELEPQNETASERPQQEVGQLTKALKTELQ